MDGFSRMYRELWPADRRWKFLLRKMLLYSTKASNESLHIVARMGLYFSRYFRHSFTPFTEYDA